MGLEQAVEDDDDVDLTVLVQTDIAGDAVCDVLEASPRGWLMGFCRSDSDCAEGLEARILAAADLIEEDDLVGQMAELRDQLDPWAERETWVNWTLDDREAWIDCFQRWTEQRPDELRAWVDG